VEAQDRPIAFRPLGRDDLPLLHEWLCREHVRRWWGEPGRLEDTVAEYLPVVEGREPTDLYGIVVDGRPVGLVQTYLITDYPDYAALIGLADGVAGVDLLLAEPDLTGQGLGTAVIRSLTRDVVFARPGTIACSADPDLRNLASIRAFEKAGFTRAREFVDPEDGQVHALMLMCAERNAAA
jgi:RimJ/RimL family protein N-acetyltransferase